MEKNEDKPFRIVPPETELSKSMEWVYHDRGMGNEPSLVRKWQKEAWDKLFGHFNETSISYELNTKWMKSGNELVSFDKSHPEQFLHRVKELLRDTDYDIHILIKPFDFKKKHPNSY